MSKSQVLEKTVKSLEQELAKVKELQAKGIGTKSLKGFLKGVNITEKDINQAKKQLSKVNFI